MLSTASYQSPVIVGNVSSTWRRFSQDKWAMLGLYGVLVLLLLSVLGPHLAPFSPERTFAHQLLLPPSWYDDGQVAFFLGTDGLGRDLLSRLLYGTTATFGSAFVITLFISTISLMLGLPLALYRIHTGSLLYDLLYHLLTLLPLLLGVTTLVALEARLLHAVLAVGLALLSNLMHAVYRNSYIELNKTYVAAARLDGVPAHILLCSVLLPNLTPTLINKCTTTFTIAISSIATLGFLQLGAQPPNSEWGLMIGQTVGSLHTGPWTVLLPGFALLFSILLVNLMGCGLQQAIQIERL